MKIAKLLTFAALFPVAAFAVETSWSDQQLINQQERQKALEERLNVSAPDISLLPNIPTSQIISFPEESPCFQIDQVILEKRDELPWWITLNKLARQAEGHCLGSQGINILMTELQNKLVGHGYITTRVVAPPQDLTQGQLILTLVKGVTRYVYYTQESDPYAKLSTAMPVTEGEILDLRDIEQGLENLQRLPTVRAEMQLIPGDEPGETDIVIHREQSRFWRVGASLDDSGTRATGRYQGGLTFYLDNPFQLSDSFYVSGGRDIDGERDRYGSYNYLFHYSVPFGYWQFSTSLSGNKYYQTVAGIPVNYEYSGRSRNASFQLSRVLHRDEAQKTTLTYGINLRQSHNYINDEEIEIQKRKTTSWQLGLQHRHYIGNNTLNLGVSYQQGVRWFAAHKAPEEYIDNGTALSQIFRYNLGLSVPFNLSEANFRYNLDIQGQHTRRGMLTAQERFSIGGRWSVRGFDGELSLSADRGISVRNELSWILPENQELYLGIDYGQVYGNASEYLLGRHLSGAALGLRGSYWGFYYDAFVGTPIYKPDLFKADDATFGFNINWSY
ncbi:ShlB/FhaC/HecB family hemolysin secretion/activation protein [Zophobihabitans entericus]|uniref:ShlB/FhaC/HecB family hemolysin secretion/activation protein n=1 Tax=Zophobihabitans entericus TaxID=1635327 RepID=A0A6G9IDY8_9GAMM|nr:ShlB/FhaC/HecB family hemolysin secretion/activation protein [Zophobihabitans entericus]QIQ22032.1 ShlB/FhaC/HecB family hemolysin secretion/activation protein [Zophobihabitans entericus]